jgi:hypothetical protein
MGQPRSCGFRWHFVLEIMIPILFLALTYKNIIKYASKFYCMYKTGTSTKNINIIPECWQLTSTAHEDLGRPSHKCNAQSFFHVSSEAMRTKPPPPVSNREESHIGVFPEFGKDM